jgi:hypothetical protein
VLSTARANHGEAGFWQVLRRFSLRITRTRFAAGGIPPPTPFSRRSSACRSGLLDFDIDVSVPVLSIGSSYSGDGHKARLRNNGEVSMHAVIRSYSGPGAKAFADILEARKNDVMQLMRPISGFVSYSFVRSADGGTSITVCQDAAGTRESMRLAADWVKQNAADTGVRAPDVTEGAVTIHFA